jgi:hypothetical protein
MLLLLFTTTAPKFLPSLAPMLKLVDVGIANIAVTLMSVLK